MVKLYLVYHAKNTKLINKSIIKEYEPRQKIPRKLVKQFTTINGILLIKNYIYLIIKS